MPLKKLQDSIAIVGMSGRFPQAKNIQEYWDNLCAGRDTITHFSEAKTNNPYYVKARGVVENISQFDAHFFGMNQREAEVTDPQHRIFLECCFEALEDAGHTSEYYSGAIGVYGSAGPNRYYYNNIFPNPEFKSSLDDPIVRIGNDHDYLTTRISYKLNFKGPSLTIQTACSSSLTAICIACNQLKTGECDMALAGGASIFTPQEEGYLYQEGMIFSPDGVCRPFDKNAKGTVPGNGAGVVVLKRLEDAKKDNDNIYAVIRGHSINNDGAEKMGFSAPSVKGQVEGITSAIEMAGVDPETIGYVEAHGTGTILGDPIEVKALSEAFNHYTEKTGFCGIGSVKSNIGHLMEVAGVAGLIKTSLALYHEKIPPSLHFDTPNPHIPFEETPFFAVDRLKEWKKGASPRRAIVNALGFGGTNAYLLLEEPPSTDPSCENDSENLIILSAKTETALKRKVEDLQKVVKKHPETSLSDIAYTLQVGRSPYGYRASCITSSRDELVFQLSGPTKEKSSVAFVFPDMPNHWNDENLSFYQSDPDFQKDLEACAKKGEALIGIDFRPFLEDMDSQPEKVKKIAHLSITYALSKMFEKWGMVPDIFIGIGLGEALTWDAPIEEIFKRALESTFSNNNIPEKSADQAFIEVTPLNPKNLLELLKELWMLGIDIYWPALYFSHHPKRVSLPSYPFERKHYWIDPPAPTTTQETRETPSTSTGLEETLTEIWKKNLGIASLSINDHFSDLGGDSLLALQIVPKIREALGVSLSPNVILKYPTIAQLAELIRREQAPQNLFTTLKEGDNSPPLFMIHQIDGFTLSYLELANALNYSGKIIGLESQFDLEKPDIAFEEACSRYVETIKKIQPNGPYYLIGTSFGGLLAYEIAQQIEKSCQENVFLVMIDIVNPDAYPLNQDMYLTLFELFSEEPVSSASPIPTRKVQIETLMKQMGFETLPYSEQESVFDLMKVHWNAFRSYHPKPYPGKVLFLEGTKGLSALKNTPLHSTWDSLIKGINSYAIDGGHLSIMKEPSIKKIGKIIENEVLVFRGEKHATI